MKIGKIISVEYDKFRVKIFHTTRNSTINIEGQVYYFGNIGSYLKALNSLGEYIMCEVISIVDRIEDENKVYGEFNLDSSREIIIKPIGTLNKGDFNMGIGVFPSLYADVEIVTYNDLNDILKYKGRDDSKIHSSINIGESKSLISYNIKLDINKLFNIHTAVLGNTGSGKSTTIAHILQEVYHKTNNSARGAKTIIFDANGEYPMAFNGDTMFANSLERVFYKPNIKEEGNDTIYNPFFLPYYLMNLDEWLSFLLASERTQKPFWDKVLQESYKFHKIFNSTIADEIEKFSNYIKWKLCQMLFNIVTRVENDTSKITAAKGAISRIRSICIKYEHRDQRDDFSDLKSFLAICDNLCVLDYGQNHDLLTNSLKSFIANTDEKKYVVAVSKENGFIRMEDEQTQNSFLWINEQDAIDVEQTKLKAGEYFDYKFLETAVDIVLLEEESRGNMHIRDFVSTLLSRLDFFLYNSECDFMRIAQNKYCDTRDYMEKVFAISDNIQDREKQLITIDSSELGTDTLELMTSVVSRMIFDYRKSKQGDERHNCPVHLILDEAHRYIHKDTNYIMRENIFEKIAREGRKYSLYLIVSSQRPSELSQTVLSQCGNYIVHRIQNEVDMKYIYSVLPYFSDDYVLKIKQAVPGEALIFGNCVPMPLMVKVSEATPAPNSKNCEISEEWFNPQSSISIEDEDDNG